MDLLTSPGVKAGPIVGSGLTLPAARLAGNSTGATGMEAISLGAGLSLSGAVLSATVAGFDGTVTAYANLPVDGSAALNAIYLVRQSSGTWLINRTQRGLYQRIATTGTRATDWQYLGEWLEEFSDANFNIYNGSDNTKALAFSLSGITTGTTRTITFPDQSGTIVLQGALTGSGLTMATARLLGRTTASTGAAEELTVGSSLSLSAGALNTVQGIRTSDTPMFAGANIGTAIVQTEMLNIEADGRCNIAHGRHSTNTAEATYGAYKSRGTAASPTTIVTGDSLFSVSANAHDGTGYIGAGQITFGSEGTVATNRTPGNIQFYTHPDSTSAIREVARFDSSGNLGLSTGYLQVDGASGKGLRYVNSTANGAVATTLGSVGPTGSTAGNPQGWLRISIAGTDRYIPFW